MEFSTGTTPKSACPASTSWNTSSTDESASARTEWPKCLSAAVCENVPSGPRKADLERLFLREAGGHDFAEQAQDFFGAQRTLVALAGHAQHLRLALRPVEIDGVAIGMLGDADLAREPRAVVEQLVDARIHGVDFTAQFHDVERWRARCGQRAFASPDAWHFASSAFFATAACALSDVAWPAYITRAASTPPIARTLSITCCRPSHRCR